jgi:hypothetical protein
VEPSIHLPPGQHPQDTEDLAFEFMEQEIGRLDWRNNWPKVKADLGEDGTRRKVQAWLNYIGIEYDPGLIIAFLDDMVKNRNGNWR